MSTGREIAATLAELVQIPSVNVLQAGPRSGPAGELALAEHIANRAEMLGASVSLDEVQPGQPNVYARFPGRTDEVVAVDVHLDTVGVEHMEGDPFDGRITEHRVYGRGAVDTKATLAILLNLLAEAKAGSGGLSPTLLLVGTISEEQGGLLGAVGFRDWLVKQGMVVDRLIVAEPTLCSPVHGHKGGVGIEVAVQGKAAHSSTPELGVNAISAAARIVSAIDAENQRLIAAGGTTAVGPGTVGVTKVAGGVAQNIVPPASSLYVGRRLAPGEKPDDVKRRLGELITAAAEPAEVELTPTLGVRAFYAPPDAPLIAELSELGDTTAITATYGSNALLYHHVAKQLVVFGPGSIDQAHQAVEWVAISELVKAADIYRQLLFSQ